MDLYANKKIKITKDTTTGRNILTMTDKEVINDLKKRNQKMLEGKRFYSTTKDDRYLSYITPLKTTTKKSITQCLGNDTVIIKKSDPLPLISMDIETVEINSEEVPISISIKTFNKTKLFIIDPSKLIGSTKDMAVSDLWNDFFYFILLNYNKHTIFVHNLGAFYGFFIYKALSLRFKPEEISCLIDHDNKFIQITLKLLPDAQSLPSIAFAIAKGQWKQGIEKFKVIFKDSSLAFARLRAKDRIFPVSLDDLCKILNVPGKTSGYKEEYHNLSLFNNEQLLEEFKIYSLQDAISLFDCLFKLQDMYLQDYNVDICSILSTSTLSMKIFRSKYLNVDIPILKRLDDSFIRNSYFGGATDHYQMKASNLHYYDVNSLYPFAMIKPMPYELIRKFTISSDFNLSDFFGFLKVEVNCPKNIKIPVLPSEYNGKTIFPTGT